MQVEKSWIERFIDWFPYNTDLYMRKKRRVERDALEEASRLARQLRPFFEKMRTRFFQEGYQAGYSRGLEDGRVIRDVEQRGKDDS